MVDFLVILILGLYVLLAVVLLFKYAKSRTSGFLWLFLAVVIWPLAFDLLHTFLPTPLTADMSFGETVITYRFLNKLIGLVLVLVAAIKLHGVRDTRSIPAA